ncbi:hypothetical protein BRC81_06580 [Halobacteriales archaeon QS_1_68_20]|nr:MAG: hypothetical protein BRC81_06580 [Halobacteriales archaeon QS_1_68_20]
MTTTRVTVDGTTWAGEAIDLTGESESVDGRDVVHVIRGEKSVDGIAVECPEPTPVYEHVGHVRADKSVRIRTALAAVARQRGLEAPQDDELAAVRKQLADLDPPSVDLSDARERVAAVDEDEVARLREEVAAHRGAAREREELGADREPAVERLTAAAGRLSDAETDKLAVEGALHRARERAREARDVREQRLRLQDRAGNLERAAREHLAGRLRGAFAAAVEAVPGEGRVPDEPESFEGDEVTAALAITRMADLRAPVVLECERFGSVGATADVLDASVIQM